MKLHAFVIGSISAVLVCILLLYKSCSNRKIEEASPYYASLSLSDSRESGRLISQLRPEPRTLTIGNRILIIDTAWIERRCRIRYSFLVIKTCEDMNGYMIAFTLQDPSDPDANIDFRSLILENQHFMTQSAGMGKRYLYSLMLDYIPDTVQVKCFYRGEATNEVRLIRR